MGYAIPISAVKDIINDLMNTKTRTEVATEKQGYLGIQALTIDQQYSSTFGMPKGVYVYKITEGGAASKSDLREKDIITKLDGSSVSSMEELQKLLTYYEGGETGNSDVESWKWGVRGAAGGDHPGLPPRHQKGSFLRGGISFHRVVRRLVVQGDLHLPLHVLPISRD